MKKSVPFIVVLAALLLSTLACALPGPSEASSPAAAPVEKIVVVVTATSVPTDVLVVQPTALPTSQYINVNPNVPSGDEDLEECRYAPLIRLRRNDFAYVTTEGKRLNVNAMPGGYDSDKPNENWIVGQFKPGTKIHVETEYSVCAEGWRWWHVTGYGVLFPDLDTVFWVDGWASEGDINTNPHRWITRLEDIGGVIEETLTP